MWLAVMLHTCYMHDVVRPVIVLPFFLYCDLGAKNQALMHLMHLMQRPAAVTAVAPNLLNIIVGKICQVPTP
jgi:hypothetical protein